MFGINTQVLVGNLGEDPEVRFTDGGQAVCNMRVAVTTPVMKKDGPAEERTGWHNVVAWGRLAEDCKGLRKGSSIAVIGETRTRSWEKNGEKRYTTEVVATFLGVPLGSADGSQRQGRDEGRGEERGQRQDDRRPEQRQGRDDRGNGRQDDRGRRDDRRPPRDDRRDDRRRPDGGTPFG